MFSAAFLFVVSAIFSFLLFVYIFSKREKKQPHVSTLLCSLRWRERALVCWHIVLPGFYPAAVLRTPSRDDGAAVGVAEEPSSHNNNSVLWDEFM